MNVNSLVMNALKGINIPVYPLFYEGDESDYVVFNCSDNRPALYANDHDICDVASLQIHYFTRNNPKPKIKQIRSSLRSHDFTITGLQEFYESDTKFYHSVIECWIIGSAETEE